MGAAAALLGAAMRPPAAAAWRWPPTRAATASGPSPGTLPTPSPPRSSTRLPGANAGGTSDQRADRPQQLPRLPGVQPRRELRQARPRGVGVRAEEQAYRRGDGPAGHEGRLHGRNLAEDKHVNLAPSEGGPQHEELACVESATRAGHRVSPGRVNITADIPIEHNQASLTLEAASPRRTAKKKASAMQGLQ